MPTTHSRRAFIRAGVLTSAGIVLHPLLRRAPAVASPVPESDVVALLRQLVADMETRVPYAAALLVDRRSTSIGVDDQTKDIGGEARIAAPCSRSTTAGGFRRRPRRT